MLFKKFIARRDRTGQEPRMAFLRCLKLTKLAVLRRRNYRELVEKELGEGRYLPITPLLTPTKHTPECNTISSAEYVSLCG